MAIVIKRFEGPITPTAIGPKPYKLTELNTSTQEEKVLVISSTTEDLADYATVCNKINTADSAWTPTDCP